MVPPLSAKSPQAKEPLLQDECLLTMGFLRPREIRSPKGRQGGQEQVPQPIQTDLYNWRRRKKKKKKRRRRKKKRRRKRWRGRKRKKKEEEEGRKEGRKRERGKGTHLHVMEKFYITESNF